MIGRNLHFPSNESQTVCFECIKNGPAFWDRRGVPFATYDPSSSASSISSGASPAPSLTPSGLPESRIEKSLLHYFCAQAAPDLSGYRSSNFWNNMVLPSMHQEPSIQHAVLALSAFHRDYTIDGAILGRHMHGATSVDSFHQYVLGLRRIQNYIVNKQKPSKKMVLICCVLFYCIEISRGDYDTALRHVKSGLEILVGWKKEIAHEAASNMNHGPSADLEDLEEIFGRLDLQIRILEEGRVPFLTLTSQEERTGAARCVPATFKNLKEAWAAMDKLTNWTSHLLAEQATQKPTSNSDLGHQKSVLQEQITRWGIAFAIFMKKQKKQIDTNKYDKTSAAMVAILYHSIAPLLHFSVVDKKQSSTDLDFHFEKIMAMCETVIDDWSNNKSQQPKGLSFETGLVPALWLLLLRCDDPAMKQRAINAMRKWDRREGAWDGQRIADVFEKVQKGGLHARMLRYPYLVQ
jgi:hypothetical protein